MQAMCGHRLATTGAVHHRYPTSFRSDWPICPPRSLRFAPAVASVITPAEPTDTSVDYSPAAMPVEVDKEQLWTPVIEELKVLGSSHGDKSSLWSIFLKGLLWGFAALLTPCVWPMIPITVSFFLNRNKKIAKGGCRCSHLRSLHHHHLRCTGSRYHCHLRGKCLNNLATSAVFNLIFFSLLFLFAISFLVHSNWCFRHHGQTRWTTR